MDTCPKCGHDDLWWQYRKWHEYLCYGTIHDHDAVPDDKCGAVNEHMHKGCHRCSYSWAEPLSPGVARDANSSRKSPEG